MGYGLSFMERDKTFGVLCVQGNSSYGVNDFVNNGDGSITDRATGLLSQPQQSSALIHDRRHDPAQSCQIGGVEQRPLDAVLVNLGR